MKKAVAILICAIIIVFSFGGLIQAEPADEYFPEGVFDRYGQKEDYKVEWFSEILIETYEPSIYTMNLDEDQSVYRLLLKGALGSPAVIVRVTIDHVTMTGSAVIKAWKLVLADIEQLLAGNPVRIHVYDHIEGTIELDTKQCEEVLSVLEENDFWGITLTLEGHYREMSTNDGEQWVIEGKQGDRYYVVNRLSPSIDGGIYDPDTPKVYRIGSWLKDLSRILIEFTKVI